MAFDTVIDKARLETAMTASANAIREKTGSTEPIAWHPDKGFAEAITSIETGGGGSADEEWFNDGNTHVWISLQEGRTSPMLGVCPNGTVTVDWGDGTTPDVLTGTSTSSVKWTPTHNYAEPGDYVITLTVDGKMGFYGESGTNKGSGILRYSSDSDARNQVYKSSVHKVEIGNGISSINDRSFFECYSLSSVFIPDGVASIGSLAFYGCYPLTRIVIPDSVISIGNNAFAACSSLTSIVIPDGVTSIGDTTFSSCTSLASIGLPDGLTSIGSDAFKGCQSLASIVIPEGVTSIDSSAFYGCYSLTSIVIPDSVTYIGNSAFGACYSLANIEFPKGVTTIMSYLAEDCKSLASVVFKGSVGEIRTGAFARNSGVKYYDFTACATVPALSSTNVFSGKAADLEIRVPAALYDEWIAETNWSSIESCIKAGQGGIA